MMMIIIYLFITYKSHTCKVLRIVSYMLTFVIKVIVTFVIKVMTLLFLIKVLHVCYKNQRDVENANRKPTDHPLLRNKLDNIW